MMTSQEILEYRVLNALRLASARRNVIIAQQDNGDVWITTSRDFVVSFDALDALAREFKTRKINLSFERGFGGSDVTPADPPELVIMISARGSWLPR